MTRRATIQRILARTALLAFVITSVVAVAPLRLGPTSAAVTTATPPVQPVNAPPDVISTAVSTYPAVPREEPTVGTEVPPAPPRVIPSPLPPAGLSISIPDATVSAAPGTSVKTSLLIGNLADTPVTVTIAPTMVALGDNGVATFGSGPDPRFVGVITLSQTQSSIPVGGFVRVEVDIAVPDTTLPDIYVLGFMATPVEPTTNVRIVTQVGMLINLDVPGPRDRNLIALFIDEPWIMITDHPSLTVRAQSVGASAVEFTSENALFRLGVPIPTSIRNEPRLLTAGRYRDLTTSWDIPWGVGIDTVTTTLLYPQTQYIGAQAVATHRVFVIKPLVVIIFLISLLLVIITIALVVAIRGHRRPPRCTRADGR